jgi:sulfite reductase (NADPH) flavoprotein alpha-component
LRIFYVVLILLLYSALCYVCWRRYKRGQHQVDLKREPAIESWLVVFATQGGMASQLAKKTAAQLQAGGISAQVLPLNSLLPEILLQQSRIFFIASTSGEGEAPDGGSRFLGRLGNIDLRHLQYGLLALGDRSYRYFCGFGHSINQALNTRGATPLFDMIEVDNGDPAALRHWQYYLGQLSGQPLFHDWTPAQYQTWILAKRHCLNAGSPGAPAYWLQLTPTEFFIAPSQWQAGDIAEIGPCNSASRIETFLTRMDCYPAEPLHQKLLRLDLVVDEARIIQMKSQPEEIWIQTLAELPHREYSIASTPAANTLDLLVRQVKHAPNDWGLGSGWLTHFAQEGERILLRIRSNPGFHPPPDHAPLILIGNGTGMAGLRAHLLARKANGIQKNWLLFGERTEAHDFFFSEEIRSLLAQGFLSHLDLVFSREAEPGAARYVQDLLPANAERLQEWVSSDAAIYVCGSLQGMAQGVDEALAQILGRTLLDQMVDERRYCRDVY